MRRTSARAKLAVFTAVVVCIVGGIVYWASASGARTVTIEAQFATAPGLYTGNQVKVLGMPVGRVTRIVAGPSYTTVTMQVPASDPVPVGARALIMAPNVVNDRYVQLTPAYTGGPRMTSGTVIPVSQTGTPVSVDQIISSLDDLSKALGPKGANANGSLSDLFAQAARVFNGNGPAVHSSLDNLGQAFGALSSDGPDLTNLINSLGNLTKVASGYTQTYEEFAGNLATVSTNLADDDQNLGAALSNLQQALGQLASFIDTNGASLGGSLTNLKVFAAAVASNQVALGQLIGDGGQALSNLSNAFDGNSLKARIDIQSNGQTLANSVCGEPLLRLLLITPTIAQQPDPPADQTLDADCGLNGALARLPATPGAGSGPNLSLSAFVGATP